MRREEKEEQQQQQKEVRRGVSASFLSFVCVGAFSLPLYIFYRSSLIGEMASPALSAALYKVAAPHSPFLFLFWVNVSASVGTAYLMTCFLRAVGEEIGRIVVVREVSDVCSDEELLGGRMERNGKIIWGELFLRVGTASSLPTSFKGSGTESVGHSGGENVYIPERGCFGNIAIFGGIGSGKTASLIYPMLETMISYRATSPRLKMAGLLLQVKSDFNERVLEIAEREGRADDITILGLDPKHKWNPIHVPSLEPESLAGRLVAVYENLVSGKQQGASWVSSGILKLLTHGIGLHRITYGYVTIKDVSELLRAASSENFEKCPCKLIVSKYRSHFKKRNPTEEELRAFKYHAAFFTGEWANENEKNRGTLLGAVSDVIGIFNNPKIAAVFCPKEEEITFSGFHTIIKSGQIVCLGLDAANHGILATIIGILLKLEFQRAALARIEQEKGSMRPKRNLFFMCDEYQEFVTAGSSRGIQGDNDFFAQARQSQVVSCIATQGIVTLISKVGREKAEELLNSIRTKLFLTLVDPDDRKRAAEICGKEKKLVRSTTLSEAPQRTKRFFYKQLSSGGKVNESHNFSERYEYIFEPSCFGQLRTFECIATIFNGVEQEKAVFIFTKPYFAPDRPHEEIIEMIS